MRRSCRRYLSRFSLAIVPVLACLWASAPPAAAAPWMWDQDQDKIDDRLTAVFLNGLDWAFENTDSDLRKRFEVDLVASVLQYGGYVRFDHIPTPADETMLQGLGAQIVTRFESVPYVRVRAVYPTLMLIAAQASVERVEAVTLMYPVNFTPARELAVRRGKGEPRITVEEAGGYTGSGVVVAVLDTGINDEVQGAYPGHVDLQGRVVGGASYSGQGPSGYSAWSASVNPSQGATGLTSYHGTHVAGSIAGGSRQRTIGGIAPGAKLVDVKVLDDDGMGHGLAEGLEWCIQNRTRNWGGGTVGIQVINLSLTGTDRSYGDDCVSSLVDTALAEGIVVVAAAGNGASCGELPPPGAADGAITITAYDPATGSLASFANEGPRADDADGGHADEMKPDAAAPGRSVASAWGSPLSNGRAYSVSSGTSMAAALTSGVVALLLEAAPALTPAQVKALLRDTAVHETAAVLGCSQGTDPYGLDPRYHSGWGWGRINARAALEEALRPGRTQFVDVVPVWNQGTGMVDVAWTTQREADLTGFLVQRAPDAGGVPGAFATVSGPIPAAGYAALSSGNRTVYVEFDAAPAATALWYRVITTGGGLSDASAPVAVRTEAPVATASFSFSHNTPETDLALSVGAGAVPQFPDWVQDIDLYAAIDSLYLSLLLGGSSAVRYQASVPLYAGTGAGAALPPSPSSPWWMRGTEGGLPERSGQLNGFSMDVGGTPYTTDTGVPLSTSEDNSSFLWIPQPATAGLPGGGPSTAPAASPNPFRDRLSLTVRIPGAPEPARVTVHDVTGRLVRTLHHGVLPAGDHVLTWDGRDDAGRPEPAGRYYLRVARPGGQNVRPVVRLP